MAKVLVSGASGQVGSRLVRQLLARNYEVRGVVLPDDPARGRLAGLDVEVVEGNLLDPATADAVVSGVDAVIHTANLVSPLPGMSEAAWFDNNVRTTYNLVRAAGRRAGSLRRFVHISSSSIYPNDSHEVAPCYHPVDELHPLNTRGVYALSKLIGEDILWCTRRETGLQAVAIRPSGILSGEAVLGRWTVAFAAAILREGQTHPGSEMYRPDAGEPWKALEAATTDQKRPCAITDGEGRPWLYQPVDARDVAHGLVCALESPAAVGESFNVAAPAPISFVDAAAVLAERTGATPLPWQAPARWVYDLSIAKAKSLIGYRPRWGIVEMIDGALAVRRGETDGMS